VFAPGNLRKLQTEQKFGYESEGAPSKRLLGLALAVLFHAFLIYGMVSGLGREITKKIQQTVNVAIIDEPKPPPPPPPPPPEDTPPDPKPQARRPTTAYVPKAETAVKASPNEAAISATTESTTEATTAVQPATPVVTSAPVAPPKPKVVQPRLKAGCALPQYPQRSLDNGEEGVVVLRFLVGLDGAVKDAALVQSSGHTRLDDAARKAFMKCRFTPGTVNGAPAQVWVNQPYRWRLE
jgi:periplasmic protein TonB